MNLTDAPQILVFAGPNGSGKSSVTSAWQQDNRIKLIFKVQGQK
jgi:predicted ABC-type ATPase